MRAPPEKSRIKVAVENGQTLGSDLIFSGFQSSGETFGARPPALPALSSVEGSLIEGCIVTCLDESQILYLTSQDKQCGLAAFR